MKVLGFPWWGVFGLDSPGQGRENRKHSFAGCCPERTARCLAMLTSSNFQTFKWSGKLTRLYPRNLTNWCPNNESPYLKGGVHPFEKPNHFGVFPARWIFEGKKPLDSSPCGSDWFGVRDFHAFRTLFRILKNHRGCSCQMDHQLGIHIWSNHLVWSYSRYQIRQYNYTIVHRNISISS